MKPRHLPPLIILLLLLPHNRIKAQSHWEITLGGEYMVTAYSFTSTDNAWGMGAEVAWWQRTDGRKPWHALRKYPSLGVKGYVGWFPTSLCGHRFGVARMMRSPLTDWLDWETGLGIATFTKPSFLTGDTTNVYITTAIVCLIDVGLNAHLKDQWQMGVRLIHSSNGMLHRPNRGLNFLRADISYRFPTHNKWEKTEPAIAETPVFERSSNINIMLSSGLVESRHYMQQGIFYCYDAAIGYDYQPTQLMKVGATVDLWYNFSYRQQERWRNDVFDVPMYIGVMGTVEGFWGAVSLKAGIGYTVIRSAAVGIPIYERVGLYYNFGNNYVGIGMNAHAGQVEFIEWSLGHRFSLGR